MRVYLAYSRDLTPEAEVAKEVIEELGLHTPEWERSLIGVSQGAIYEGSRRNMAQSDLFVGLVGQHYGWVLEKGAYNEETFDGETSFLHSEFLWAAQQGLPMLVFFAPNIYTEEAPPETTNELIETEPDRIQRLRELRRYLAAHYFCNHFDSPNHLRQLLGMSLMRLIHMQRYGDGTNRDLIYISHSTKDDAFVDKLSASLYEAGLYPWVDHHHIPAGARWDAVLEHAINASDSLVLVISPDSVRSTVVESEWTFMGELGRKIYPVLLRSDTVPFRLRVLQYTDFREDYDTAITRLLEALSAPGAAAKVTNEQARDAAEIGVSRTETKDEF